MRLLYFLFFYHFISISYTFGSEHSSLRVNPPKILQGTYKGLNWNCEIYDNSENDLPYEVREKISALEYENFKDIRGGYKDCPTDLIDKYEAANTPEELLNLYEGSPKGAEDDFQKPQVFFFLLKNKNQELIAFSAWALRTDEQGLSYAQIKRFHIRRGYQKHGNGRAFLNHCLAEIAKVSYVVVDASACSMPFYLKSLKECLGRGVLMNRETRLGIIEELSFLKLRFNSTLHGYFNESRVVLPPTREPIRGRFIVTAAEEVVIPGGFDCEELIIISPLCIISGDDRFTSIGKLFTTAKVEGNFKSSVEIDCFSQALIRAVANFSSKEHVVGDGQLQQQTIQDLMCLNRQSMELYDQQFVAPFRNWLEEFDEFLLDLDRGGLLVVMDELKEKFEECEENGEKQLREDWKEYRIVRTIPECKELADEHSKKMALLKRFNLNWSECKQSDAKRLPANSNEYEDVKGYDSQKIIIGCQGWTSTPAKSFEELEKDFLQLNKNKEDESPEIKNYEHEYIFKRLELCYRSRNQEDESLEGKIPDLKELANELDKESEKQDDDIKKLEARLLKLCESCEDLL